MADPDPDKRTRIRNTVFYGRLDTRKNVYTVRAIKLSNVIPNEVNVKNNSERSKSYLYKMERWLEKN